MTVVDAAGATAVHSGANSLGINTHLEGENAVAAGNLLADERVIAELLGGYAASTAAAMEERLLDGFRAALAPAARPVPCIRRECLWWRTFRGRSPTCVDHSDTPPDDLAALWDVETTEERLPGAWRRPDERAVPRCPGRRIAMPDNTIEFDTAVTTTVTGAHRALVDCPATCSTTRRSPGRRNGRRGASPINSPTPGSPSPAATATCRPPSPPPSDRVSCISDCAPNTTRCPASGTRAGTT